jgi:hypothetical protein
MGMSHEMLRIGGVGNRSREMFVASKAREPLGHVFDSMPFHLKMSSSEGDQQLLPSKC